jgi:hypothetical protein
LCAAMLTDLAGGAQGQHSWPALTLALVLPLRYDDTKVFFAVVRP